MATPSSNQAEGTREFPEALEASRQARADPGPTILSRLREKGQVNSLALAWKGRLMSGELGLSEEQTTNLLESVQLLREEITAVDKNRNHVAVQLVENSLLAVFGEQNTTALIMHPNASEAPRLVREASECLSEFLAKGRVAEVGEIRTTAFASFSPAKTPFVSASGQPNGRAAETPFLAVVEQEAPESSPPARVDEEALVPVAEEGESRVGERGEDVKPVMAKKTEPRVTLPDPEELEAMNGARVEGAKGDEVEVAEPSPLAMKDEGGEEREPEPAVSPRRGKVVLPKPMKPPEPPKGLYFHHLSEYLGHLLAKVATAGQVEGIVYRATRPFGVTGEQFLSVEECKLIGMKVLSKVPDRVKRKALEVEFLNSLKQL